MLNFIPKLCQTGRVWGFEAMPWTLRTLARQTWPSSRDCKGAGTGIPIVWPQDDDRWYAAKEEIWSTGVGFYVPMFHITQLQRGYFISNRYGKVMWNKSPKRDIYQPLFYFHNLHKLKCCSIEDALHPTGNEVFTCLFGNIECHPHPTSIDLHPTIIHPTSIQQ